MKFITEKKGLGLGELVYLQSKRCDVNISHHAGHLFSFKNLGGVLHEHQTSYRHWVAQRGDRGPHFSILRRSVHRSESWFKKTHV